MHIKKRQITAALDETMKLLQAGRSSEASELLGAILKADGKVDAALHLLGLIEGQQGHFDQAEEHIRKAIRISPNIADYHNSFGVLLRKQDKLKEAEKAYNRCLELDRKHYEALGNMATLLRYMKRYSEAEQYARKVVEQKMDAKSLANLAASVYEQGRLLDAQKLFLQALDLPLAKETDKVIQLALLEIAWDMGWAEAYAERSRMLSERYASALEASNYLMTLNYLDTVDAVKLSDEHRRCSELFGKDDGKCQSLHLDGVSEAHRPLRIGYISPDFVEHPVSWLIEPIIERHDRKQFFVVCYDVHHEDLPVYQPLKDSADLWRDCRGMRSDSLRSLIDSDKIDILVDLTGHTGGNRLPLFARRAAPVQVSWLGYYHTTGIEAMDWLIADGYSIAGGEERYFTEQVWRLPHFRFPFRPRFPEILDKTVQQKEQRPLVFVSCNNIIKIHERVLKVWAKILDCVPGAELHIRWKTLGIADVQSDFKQRFKDAGGDIDRLKLFDQLSYQELLASYEQVDIALDPFPFGGGMTTLDALWMGVPVVTRRSDRMVGRQTEAFVSLAGHTELVATNEEAYINLAVRLANDEAMRNSYKQNLRSDLLTSPLCDEIQFVKDIEYAFRQIWQMSCEKSIMSV